jgi:methylmalonyl-CoA/ethylmalonyl-CoA epimerase
VKSGGRILGISHVGLAPKDPARSRWFFGEVLGLPHLGDELVEREATLTAMFATRPRDGELAGESAPASDQRLEVLMASPEGQGPIARFLEKKGSGIHHVALNVEGLDQILVHLKSQGVRMVNETPLPGAHHTRIAFVHPDSTGGLLVEFVESSRSF